MTEMPQNSKDIYEIMENDNGEVMILIYAGEEAPQNPGFSLNEAEHLLELTRKKDDIVQIAGLQQDALDKLKNLKTLYICELKYNEDPDAENEILHAYAATLKKKGKEPQPTELPKPNKQEALSEKIRQTRAKVLSQNKPNNP